MSIKADIERIQHQENRLRLQRFDKTTAWELGSRLKTISEQRDTSLVIEVRLARETVFFYAMHGTAPTNIDWVRRKRNTAELLQRSSYAVGRSLEVEGLSLEEKLGLPPRHYATHGGSFPIWVESVGCIGTVTVSGAPQREDHEIVVAALAELCHVPLSEVALA
jgi:uncharacterized protein (UPF0303 family)